MPRKGYMVVYLVQTSETNLKVVILAVTSYDLPLIEIFNSLEEAKTVVFGITGAHLPELAPITKDVFWANVEKLKKEDSRLISVDFGSVKKRLL